MTGAALSILLAMAVPVQAGESGSRKASDAARDFTLDLGEEPVDDAVTAPAQPVPEPAEAAPEPVEAVPAAPAEPTPAKRPAKSTPAKSVPAKIVTPVPGALFTLDTPIGQLIADPRSRAVLDKNLPGLSTDENLAKFRGLSLRQFQPMTGGQLTDELLQQTATDLAAIKPVVTGRRRLDSR